MYQVGSGIGKQLAPADHSTNFLPASRRARTLPCLLDTPVSQKIYGSAAAGAIGLLERHSQRTLCVGWGCKNRLESLSTTKEKRYGYSSNKLVKSRGKTRNSVRSLSSGSGRFCFTRSGSELIASARGLGINTLGLGTGIVSGNKPFFSNKPFIVSELGQGRHRARCA